MKLNHAMIDIEALGNCTNGLILSIGAINFDPHGDLGVNEFKVNISIQSALNAGAKINGSNIEWWLRQEIAAIRAAFYDPLPLPELEALRALRRWLDEFKIEYVWSHGCNYDLRLLAQAYERHDYRLPWHYRNERDTRTLFEAANIGDAEWRVGHALTTIAHDALQDAIRQARVVQLAYQKLAR